MAHQKQQKLKQWW